MTESESNTALNALVGAVVTIVLSFTGISPVIGGAVAGYLEKRDGVRVGAISGAIAAVPLLLLAGIAILALLVFSAGAPRFGIVGAFAVLFGIVLGLLYTVGLSALGGYLGVYLATEADL